MHLFTDASGSKGWGAFWSNKWLQAEWSSEQAMHNIIWNELYTIMFSQYIGPQLGQKKDFVLL